MYVSVFLSRGRIFSQANSGWAQACSQLGANYMGNLQRTSFLAVDELEPNLTQNTASGVNPIKNIL